MKNRIKKFARDHEEVIFATVIYVGCAAYIYHDCNKHVKGMEPVGATKMKTDDGEKFLRISLANGQRRHLWATKKK